ncbi:LOW QUALITY PROTEIN: antitoxin VapB [Enterobacter sp. WP_7_1]|nr:LOW QUALITY PROTEIN: antitoxin VapB [Enterobacter sp. WP_7_1]RMA87492.1 LOW QUALITY PROTEIN: antitoxin VapB [Enterobacter sp. WP_7_2]
MPGICMGMAYAYTHYLHMLCLYICSTSAYTWQMHAPGAMNLIPDMHHISILTREKTMRTVSIFKNGNNRAIRLPRDLDFEGVSELEIVREGDSIILRPVRPTWGSFLELEKADPDFMAEREDVVSDEGRFNL